MAISGSFMAGAATLQPMAQQPPPNNRHGQKTQPDNSWSAPPASTGMGYPDAQPVDPQMQARGIVLDLGHQWGHEGTRVTRNSRRPWTVGRSLGGLRPDAQYVEQGAAQEASAAAHGDRASAYLQGHQYSPWGHPFSGETYGVDRAEGQQAPAISGRVIAKTNGHGFPEGPVDAMYAPTGFRIGVSRRWAQARYSSPTLGAMYSRNTLRGVLGQKISVPVNQPALSGVRDSGIASNARFLAPFTTVPKLFRSPPSQSDQAMAANAPDPTVSNAMGVGF